MTTFALEAAIARQTDLLESVKSNLISLQRDRRKARPDVAQTVIRALVCRFKAQGTNETPEDAAVKLFGSGQRGVVEALRDLPKFIARAAVNPAMTSVSGWASELVGSENYPGLLPSLAPASVYAQLSARGLRLDFTGVGTVKVPGRSATPSPAGAFIGENSPIPTRRLGAVVASVGPPKKLACLSYFSDELRDRSTPTIESVLRETITNDTGNVLDAALLDNVAGSATRPPGLLNVAANGAITVTPAAGGGTVALAADFGALASAIINPVDLVYVMNPADQVRALTVAPGVLGVTIITAPTLTAKTVIAIDAADFVSGEGDAPRIRFVQPSDVARRRHHAIAAGHRHARFRCDGDADG